jgi:hypothetical protein
VDVPAPRPGRFTPRLAFGVHQVADYALGVALFAAGLHLGGATQLLALSAGGALVLINLLTVSRLTLRPLLSRRAHHLADLVLVAALIAAAATLYRELHTSGVILGGGIALLLLWVERSTRYVPASATLSARATSGPVLTGSDVTAGRPAGATSSASRRRLTTRSARTAGTVVGVTRRVLRDRARRASTPPSSLG